jgi:hypothetical protein
MLRLFKLIRLPGNLFPLRKLAVACQDPKTHVQGTVQRVG